MVLISGGQEYRSVRLDDIRISSAVLYCTTYNIYMGVIKVNDTQYKILETMSYGVVAKKRGYNKYIFIKLNNAKLFNVALRIYFNYGFYKLPEDVRPVLTNIGSELTGINKVYYIVDTDMEAFIDGEPVDVSQYKFVKDEDIFEAIDGVSDRAGIDKYEDFASLVLNYVNNDGSIKATVCKNECKSCNCMKEKIKNDIKKVYEEVFGSDK